MNSDSVTASARASLDADGGSVTVGRTTKVLARAITADTRNALSPLGASADASFLVHAEGGSVNLGPVTVQASAEDNGRFEAKALADASIVASIGFPVAIHGNIEVLANAQDLVGSSASAVADLGIRGRVVTVGLTSQTLSGGSVEVHALADGAGRTRASASLGITASAQIAVDGNLAVTATANGNGQADANAFANLSTYDGFAGANVANSVDVAASAHGSGGASANAMLSFNTRRVTAGNMSVVAHATNTGSGTVNASGAVTFRNNASIQLGDVTIDVEALNESPLGSGGARANAIFAPVTNEVTVNGLNIDAVASSAGGGGAFANAVAIIADRFAISIAHDVTVNARALNADGVGNATALADLQLTVQQSGDVIMSGNVDVQAFADDQASGGRAKASAHGIITAKAVDSGGNIRIGTIDGFGASSGNLHVDATALDASGKAQAFANASLNADRSIRITGHVGVFADASDAGNRFAVHSGSANAVALLLANAGIGIDVGPGSGSDAAVDVVAVADNFGPNGKAVAVATGTLEASNAIDIHGAVLVDAFAFDAHGDTALANAILNISGSAVSIGHDLVNFQSITASGAPGNKFQSDIGIFVGAFAIDHGTIGKAVADASANIRASFGTINNITFGDVTVGGAAIFSALASDTGGHSANAQAHLQVNGAQVNLNGGTVDIGGSHNDYIGVFERAIANAGNDGTAIGNAIASVYASNALLINGEVVDVALAFNPGGGGNALADADLSLTANNGNATIIGSLLVVAHASDGGEGSAIANASANITVGGSNRTINITSGASVSASAFNLRGQDGLAASANAHLRFQGANNIIVPHHLRVNAFAVNSGSSTVQSVNGVNVYHPHVIGSGSVNAHGSVGFGNAAHNVTLGDVSIDVEALNLPKGGFGGASASAIFAPNPSIKLTLAGLDVEAEAASAGGQNAFANAYANIHETGIASILDGVTVKATAINGLLPGNATEPGNATASAHFILANASKIELGNLTVMASATNYEHGNVHAVGTANLDPPATMNLNDVTHRRHCAQPWHWRHRRGQRQRGLRAKREHSSKPVGARC